MNIDFESKFLSASDDKIRFHLGIPNFSEYYLSYGKILYNHSILSYDNDAIYLIDKLHLTFSSFHNFNNHVSHTFYKREPLNIDKHLILKPNYGNGNNYHYSFHIEFDGVYFGYLHLKNTKRTNICKIEVDNRALYELSIIEILSRLFYVSNIFELQFKNINTYEIARDSISQMYSRMSEVYYQSTKCNKIIHDLHGIKPKFRPVTKSKIHDYPNNNGSNGTFIIGTNNSDSIIRVYNKSLEIEENNCKKEYIFTIYDKHFGFHENINRVEAVSFSNAFHNGGLLSSFGNNLIELLLPMNFAQIFYIVLGDKLTFNDLTTKTWDAKNNDKYEKFRLLPTYEKTCIQHKRIYLQTINKRFSHNDNIQKYKYKFMEYLNREIRYIDLKRYFMNKKSKNELNITEVEEAHKIILRNYRNPLDQKEISRVQKLIILLKEKRNSMSNRSEILSICNSIVTGISLKKCFFQLKFMWNSIHSKKMITFYNDTIGI